MVNNILLGRLSQLSLVALITIFFCSSLKAELSANGYGIYEEFGAPLYAVKLESEQRIRNSNDFFTNENQKTLALKVLAGSVDERQWCRLWTQNISINISSADLERLADSLLKVCDRVSGDLLLGDKIVFHRQSSNLTILSINDVDFGSLEGEGIFEAFLSAFLGSSPASSDLRTALLNQPDGNSNAALVFQTSNISPDRVTQVRSWIAPPEPAPVAIAEPVQVQIVPNQEIAAINLKYPDSSDAANASLAAGQGSEASKISADSSAWSAVSTTEYSASYETSDFNQEPILASAAYMPNSNSLLASTAFDMGQVRPKEKLVRISLLDIQKYQTQSLRQVYEFIEYPSIAERRGREGSLRLKVEIDRSGNIRQISSLETSRFDELNQAAEFAVQQAAPFEAPPLAEDEEFFELLLPIRFSLQ